MKINKFLLSLLFLFLYFQAVAAPQDLHGKSGILRIEPQEHGAGQVKMVSDGNNFHVTTAGGFIKIQSKQSLGMSGSRLYVKRYFNLGDTVNAQQVTSGMDQVIQGIKIYLLPGQEYIIEILQRETNLLIFKYIIKRPILIPKVSFFDPNSKSKSLWDTFSDKNMSGGFSLSARNKISLRVVERSDFTDLSIDYNLRNLETKEELVGKFLHALDELPVEANTSYRLLLSYSIQKEVPVVVYIKIKPYWYKSVITYGLIGVVMVIIILLFITRNMSKLLGISKDRQQRMEDAAIRLQSLLNPHFTFNALSAIQGLINTGRIEDANFYLQEFSMLLRKTLANSESLFSNLGEELEMMGIYMRLEALRFNFTWSVLIDPELRPAEIEIPTMIIQPVVENAVKHGIANLRETGILKILCKQGEQDHTFAIIIEDNGVWQDANTLSGYGLSLTRKRIDAINKLDRTQLIELEIKTDFGTQIIITFHNWINT
ncbi:hypothetical protein GJU39_21080 [Pedobacter petrophilus]|uniref:Signal transduction histidine kinase internal region domain-containing protein n=2 Tax=Pedobacter TaxID=84567 RepID=A0A7K0G444_9SPHI|nr:histidine kinase [Pedobacter petrophilus]MRX78577.1 hypothetical protein [Pedobacter petrophilus]